MNPESTDRQNPVWPMTLSSRVFRRTYGLGVILVSVLPTSKKEKSDKVFFLCYVFLS